MGTMRERGLERGVHDETEAIALRLHLVQRRTQPTRTEGMLGRLGGDECSTDCSDGTRIPRADDVAGEARARATGSPPGDGTGQGHAALAQ